MRNLPKTNKGWTDILRSQKRKRDALRAEWESLKEDSSPDDTIEAIARRMVTFAAEEDLWAAAYCYDDTMKKYADWLEANPREWQI